MQPESTLKAEPQTQSRPTMVNERISEQNRKCLEAIKEIIEVEEEKNMSFDETLGRVLSHYRQFVPFQIR
jgi:hypothetical protein